MYYSDAVDDRGLYGTWLIARYTKQELADMVVQILKDMGLTVEASLASELCEMTPWMLSQFVAHNRCATDHRAWCLHCAEIYDADLDGSDRPEDRSGKL